MSFKVALIKHLRLDAAVHELVADRIAFGRQPQGTPYPCLNLHVISMPAQNSLHGPLGVDRVTVQVDAWAEDGATVESLTSAVRTRLDGFRGDMQGVHVHSAAFEGGLDAFAHPTDGSDLSLHRATRRIQLLLREHRALPIVRMTP